MSSVQRSKGIRKVIRRFVFKKPVQRYIAAGDRACQGLVREAYSRRQPCPSNSAILAWARYDLACEIMNGFWDVRAA